MWNFGNILILLNNFKWPLKALPNQVWIIFLNLFNQISEISYKIMQESNQCLKNPLFQNKIFPELNSKKHTPSPTVWFLRNCRIAQNSSCGIVQNLSFARAEKHNLQNDFCELLRKLLFFHAKLMCIGRKILRFVLQKFCEWKP